MSWFRQGLMPALSATSADDDPAARAANVNDYFETCHKYLELYPCVQVIRVCVCVCECAYVHVHEHWQQQCAHVCARKYTLQP
jgi:hypothetical protein